MGLSKKEISMHIMANISRLRVKLRFPLSLFNVFNDESDQHQQASLLLDAKVERSDIAGMEENLHPVARSFSNQSFQATAGRSQNRLEPKTSSENFRHNPEMSDLSTLASKSKDAC